MKELRFQLPKKLQSELVSSDIGKEATAFYEKTGKSVKRMFGYPAHHVTLSPHTQYLLLMHYSAPFSNNCGDVEERGNYDMDTKDVEKNILRLYAEKFGMGEEFWGYVTSGGSESNSCGITLAFNKYPNGILYYSQSAHYSVEKYARLYPHKEIPTTQNDEMNVEALFAEIAKNWANNRSPANLVLTHGTTKFGACDDVDKIVAFLKEREIPCYIHVDAALFGGIPNNQTDAPLLVNAKARGIDSVCVSLHKYVGFPDVHSVFVSTKKPESPSIAYIGQHDTTVSGSRSIPAFALYNHIREQVTGRPQDEYIENVRFFESLLQKQNIPYHRAPKGNIFVFDAPSEQTTKRFQLSTFTETVNGKETAKAHAIIFPHHGKKEMEELAKALKENLK
ncbi:MAG: hypothetical protein IJ329_03025 [Clostridia bacterium]|nr:hypothetical protein [Clostridia bacterium]